MIVPGNKINGSTIPVVIPYRAKESVRFNPENCSIIGIKTAAADKTEMVRRVALNGIACPSSFFINPSYLDLEFSFFPENSFLIFHKLYRLDAISPIINPSTAISHEIDL